ncbi:MAG: alpha-2-macroglobulin family protein [Verrucomicrobiota bacterium]
MNPLLRLFCLFAVLPLLAADLSAVRRDAESLFAEGSFAKAHEAYLRAGTNALAKADARWLAFRLADSGWRASVTASVTDGSPIQEAARALEGLAPKESPVADRDLVWAEANEALGDLRSRTGGDRTEVHSRYGLALDWWAGRRDIDLARGRYLAIVWKWHRPAHLGLGFPGFWNEIPVGVLDNAVAIARDPDDIAHARFLRAATAIDQGLAERGLSQVEEDLQAAIQPGKATAWFDDALFRYANWLATSGKLRILGEGRWQREPDPVRALAVYRRIVAEFKQGETRYWPVAKQQAESITAPQLSVGAQGVFLPGSETQFTATWRNVETIGFTLTPVDLARDVQLTGPDQNPGEWLQTILPGGAKPVLSWTAETGDNGEHLPGNRMITLTNKLATGAYLLEAKAGGPTARELLLVSDATLVLKTSGKTTLAWFVDALSGKPIGEAAVKLAHGGYDEHSNRLHVEVQEKRTDAGGIARFDQAGRGGQLFVAASGGGRQAFVMTGVETWNVAADGWKIQAFTDRPAYRPGELAQWKLTARRSVAGAYSTPAGMPLYYAITGPQGTVSTNGVATLNAFGSAWGNVLLGEKQALGEYRVQFWDDAKHERPVGDATLFRVEEYKLPEFEVKVLTPEEDAPGGGKRKKSFRLGDRVEIVVQAAYYSGGPVAEAAVEVVVKQGGFYWPGPMPREFPWLYEPLGSGTYFPDGRLNRGGFRPQSFSHGQVVKQQTLKTDTEGRASLVLETDANGGDIEFHIEARVTDAARREVSAVGSVRVTRQSYNVAARPANNLPRPGDKLRVAFTAKDANSQPVVTTGTVKVTRDRWWEVWLDSFGREVKGDALRAARERSPVWPPKPEPGMKDWRLKSAGFQQDDVATHTVQLDAEGRGELAFTTEREGYYRFVWSSPGDPRPGAGVPPATPRPNAGGTAALLGEPPVTAVCTVWVTTARTTDLGYRTGGLELIVDADTFRVGQTAPVMVVGPAADRWVLFTVEAGGLDSFQAVHLTGTTKLLELPVTERHVPDAYLGAVMVQDRQLLMDEKEIVVPPTKNFLSVELEPDRADHLPRDDGSFTVTTRDHEGRPVSAEVAMSLVDESVFYIQADYAEDPRQFFFGDKRGQQMRSESSFNQRQFLRLVRSRDGTLRDDRSPDPEEALPGLLDARHRDGDASREALPRTKFDGLRSNPVLAMRYGLVAGAAGSARAMASKSTDLSMLGVAMPDALGAMTMGRPVLTGGSSPAPAGPAVVVRSDFRATAFWQPDVKTGADGTARVTVRYPESLTRWKATARAATTGNQVGWTTTNTRTRQPLMVRLQTPRFLVAGDRAVVSALLDNDTADPIEAEVGLDIGTGPTVRWVGAPPTRTIVRHVRVAAHAQARADWPVEAVVPGDARFVVTARSGTLSDAMQRVLPVEEHGIEKFLAKSGKATAGGVTVKLDLPARKPGSTRLTVSVTPSLAVTMLDALPYLADYPYGCTEQTLSRFLPATIVRQTLLNLGLDAETAMARAFGGIAQSGAGASPALGTKKDLTKLDTMIAAGLDRLAGFQHGDGGWGWWQGGESDAWMTAYVVCGLNLAEQAQVKVDNDRLRRALVWLELHLAEAEEDPALQAWMLHALAGRHASVKAASIGGFQAKAVANLWSRRDQLDAYTRSLFALAAHDFGDHEKAAALVRALSNGVIRDDKPDTSVLLTPSTINSPPSTSPSTAHWGETGGWRRWSESGVETTAFALRALLAIDPKNPLVEPAANWLLKNRRGAQWSNTRDTAIVILALDDYLRVTGELKADLDYEVVVNGRSLARRKVTPAEIVRAPSVFSVDPAAVRDANEVRIVRRGGTAPVYFTVQATFSSAEEPVAPAGNQVFVRRTLFRLVPRATLLNGTVSDREPLEDGGTVTSGERIETVLTIEAKNDLEYLLVEDLKPAGFEAVEVRSGGGLYAREVKPSSVTVNQAAMKPGDSDEFTGRTRWVHPEWRDREAALFVDKLPQGIWEIRHTSRAETPGRFHALPALAHAMYVPEIRANSGEVRLEVKDLKPPK